MSAGVGPVKAKLPRWARILTVVYLVVVAGLVGAVLVLSALESAPAVVQGLMLALAALTLPVSAGYLFVSFLASVGSSSSVGGHYVGALSLTAGAFHLGYVVLALINAALFRWILLNTRRRAGVPMSGNHPEGQGGTLRGVNRAARRQLLWAVPLAVLLSLPQWLVAAFAWCGISGCSGGGFGVTTTSEWLAITLTVVNGVIMAVAVFAVPWLFPTGKRALVAVAAGILFALVGASYTHG